MKDKFDSPEQARIVANLCIGQLFEMMSIKYADGDIIKYETIRLTFFDAMDYLQIPRPPAPQRNI